MKKTVQQLKALADETRLRILALLAGGELCVCDLMAILELPQSTVSRHLATLRHAGWVEDRRQGVWMYYRLRNHDQTLSGEWRGLLHKHLSGLPRVELDRQALAAYRAGMESGRCG
jgi:ArsR family transcriptional regulator